jgi:hypothetical protein
MENSMKTVVDKSRRKEIYNHEQTTGFASGINLKPIENFTQEREYEILAEKNGKDVLSGMIYTVKDDEGNTRHVSDRYFHQKEPVLCFDHSRTDWEDVVNPATGKYLNKEDIRQLKKDTKKDLENCFENHETIDAMPSPACCAPRKPTVRGLKEEYEANIQLNKLAGTWKGKQIKGRQPRPRDEVRFQKSSIEKELETLRETCLDMVERIDAMTNAVEAVRKFA